MTLIKKDAVVPYTASEMFGLVNNIETYPQFLSWCSAAIEQYRSEEVVRASLEIRHGAFSNSFTISHQVRENEKIEMHLVEGPFQYFKGLWYFEPIVGNGCKISFELEFKFSSALLGLVAGPVFRQIADSLLDAFSERAKDVYGVR